MKLVIDTGILISALLKNSITREILLFSTFEFLIPEYSFEELEKHKDAISTRSGLNKDKIDIVLSMIMDKITVVPDSKIKPYMEKAYGIIGSIDPFDVPFIALALSVENNGIWSNDKHFQSIKGIKVWKTADIFTFLKQ